MSVTEYKPKSTLGCRYSYDKLENVIYLVSKSHTKKVFIDNGEAYISGLTTVPMRLEGFNIQFTEESSLDERYKFTKQVTFSIHGYVPHTAFEGKYYVILKSKDGTKWMVNVDFPSKVIYDFHLDGQQYQTDFTFSSVSNFPTLRLASELDEGEDVCKQFKTYGIEYLKLLETDYCRLDTVNSTVYTYGKDFVDVEYLGQSCSLEEQFDGEKVTTTIQFNIAFDAYKSSWHYNLLEFLQNHYSAVIKPKGSDHYFFSGFNFGLEPSFNIATTSQNGQSDIITVTLVETSSYGSKNSVDWDEQGDEDTRWVYVKNVGSIQGWECVGANQARYLLQQEVYKNGVPTGRYKAYQGHTFPTLNIVGYFSTDYRFVETSCSSTICDINTTIPTLITYRSATCNTYTISASCDWNVSGLASYMTVTPSSGLANTQYTVSVCNTKTPTENETSTFNINTDSNVIIVNVELTTESEVINPTSQTITCLNQNVTFNFNPNCPITVTSIDSRLTYRLTNSQLIVTVPRNESTANTITWDIAVKDCQNRTQTVQIIQDKTYERWVTVDGYICDGTTSYTKQQRYTGTTSTNINTPTSEYNKGTKIQDDDPRCGSSETKWETSSYFYCVNGDKWSFEEEYVRYDGGSWQPTGRTRLKSLVEASSSFCEESVEYKWVLTTEWQCFDVPPIYRWNKAPATDYVCVGVDKHYKEYYQVSYDNGATWENVVPTSSRTSEDVIEYNSTDCGYVPPQYRWQPSGTTCIGYDKWQQSIKQVSTDGGSTWTNVVPNEFSATSLIEADSEDCGYVPPTPTFDGKFRATYSDSTTYSAACDSSTSLTTATTRAHSTSYTAMTTAEIGGCITSIGEYAFQSCSGLTSVDIPTGVTSIGYAAFMDCTSLTSITIPSGVTSIGKLAFIHCSGLTSVTIPDSVTSIGDNAFYTCKSLPSITIPDSVTSIGQDAFGFCSGLTSCTIGTGVTSIGYAAFEDCYGLTSVTIPSDVTSIGNYAFNRCRSLTSITVDSNNTYYTSEDGVLFNKAKTTLIQYPIGNSRTSYSIPSSVTSIGTSAFEGCNRLTSVTIGTGVTSIGYEAFGYCNGLTSITIPDSVTSIGGKAFWYCESLTSITVEATTPPTLGTSAFNNTNNCPIYVPASSVNAYKTASNWSTYASRIQAIP